MKKTLLWIVVVVITSGIISCSGPKEQPKSDMTNDSAIAALDSQPYNKMADFKFFFTIANLPSPLEVINTVYNTDVPFDNTLLNPTDHVEKYLSAYKKSINYGVYGVDMAYIAYYGNKQDLYDYYNTARKLAESLGTQETFDKFTDRFKDNADNKDSIMVIVDEAYTETDKFLRSNSRLMAASYVLAGSFIESLYISTTLLKDQEKNVKFEASYKEIFDQKLMLDNLADLFKQYKDKESVALEKDLQDLKKVFDEVKDNKQMNKEALQKIAAAVGVIRNKAIQ